MCGDKEFNIIDSRVLTTGDKRMVELVDLKGLRIGIMRAVFEMLNTVREYKARL